MLYCFYLKSKYQGRSSKQMNHVFNHSYPLFYAEFFFFLGKTCNVQ